MASSDEFYLSNKERRIFGRIVVDRAEGTLRMGVFSPIDWPDELRVLFERYDDLINEQVLAALDEIEDEVMAIGFCVLDRRTDTSTQIRDLQITRDGLVSFRVLE